MALSRCVRSFSPNCLGRAFSSGSVVAQKSQLIDTSSNSTTSDSLVYGPDHVLMQDTLRRLIDTEINPNIDEWEKQKRFPAKKVFKLLGDNGFLGITKPKEYGGLGLDYSYSAAVAEELGSIRCGGVPMAIGVQTDMATPALAKFGSDYLKKEFLAPSISGDRVACLGVSEVGSGSDVASVQTKASRNGDDLIINGGKMWTTNGAQADWMCLLANTNPGKPHTSKSLICMPMDAPGVQVSREIQKMGMHCSDTAQVFLEDVRVPYKNIIGEEGQGFTYQMIQFQEERIFAAAVALRPLEIIINDTIAYTQQRKIFGQPIINNQYVQFTLAELATEVELLKSLLYRSIALYIRGQDVTKLASMCKLKVGRLLREVSDKCLQFWGGMGYTDEVAISRYYRDMRLISIGGGADEVMLSIICKYMRMLPKPSKSK